MNNTKQSKKETDETVFKIVLKEVKANKHGFSPQLFWFVFLTLLSLCLAYLLPYSLIVTIPLVILPSYFAFTAMNVIKGTKNSEGVTFWRMYRAYFSQLFFGGYRVWIGLLKSFGAYFVSTFVGFLIFDLTFLNGNSEYQEILNKSMDPAQMNQATSELLDFLSRPEFAKFLFFLTAFSILLAVFFFVHHIFKNSIKMRRNVFSKTPFPIRQFAIVDRKVRSKNRKFLLHTYFTCSWFIKLSLLLAAGGGIVFSYFFLKELNPIQAAVISMFLMFVVSIPFLNYISTLEDYIFFCFAKQYEDTFVSITLEFLTKFKDKIGIEEEEAKKIQEMLEAQKKEFDEPKKEDKKDDEN